MEVTLRLLVAALCVASLAALADAQRHNGCVTLSWGTEGTGTYVFNHVEVDFSNGRTTIAKLNPAILGVTFVGVEAAVCGARSAHWRGNFTVTVQANDDVKLLSDKAVLIAVGHTVPFLPPQPHSLGLGGLTCGWLYKTTASAVSLQNF